MPRSARQTPGGFVYHALNRAAARLTLFRKAADYEAFLRVLDEAVAEGLITIEAVRVLRPGGHFFLADPTMPVWLSQLFPHFGANRSHQPAALRSLFAQARLPVHGQPRVRSLFLLVTIAIRPEESRES